MEGVEDIPGTALYEGMPWGEWETFPEYLALLDRREFALDVGTQLSHGALRNYVMGARGRANEAPTARATSSACATSSRRRCARAPWGSRARACSATDR